MNRIFISHLVEMQGSKEKRMKRIKYTVSELCTQMTQQFAKSWSVEWQNLFASRLATLRGQK